ncbi:MAG: hypothetical protein AVDCRST_MAG59-5022 [uncultured Thermomicrobiales bacterium]|uniref:Uncharacterized protein n=1 Tax=uncultured Thermomicrobiales bacterium TaxID=1645740 RepID=A0A6J4VLL4_9BACT|nr:MAG: hypothetical protein AVDCRST_MAG59-5022 [uncultured Thermomicrobiales bacterium]
MRSSEPIRVALPQCGRRSLVRGWHKVSVEQVVDRYRFHLGNQRCAGATLR